MGKKRFGEKSKKNQLKSSAGGRKGVVVQCIMHEKKNCKTSDKKITFVNEVTF